jgi:hypothetical protein
MALPERFESEKPLREAVPYNVRLMLDQQAAADMLSVSVKTLEKLPILRVKIPGVRRTLYRMVDLEMYVRALPEER